MRYNSAEYAHMLRRGGLPERKGSYMYKNFLVISTLAFEPNVTKGVEEGGLNLRGGAYNWYKKVTNMQEYQKIFSTLCIFFLASRNTKQKHNKHTNHRGKLWLLYKASS